MSTSEAEGGLTRSGRGDWRHERHTYCMVKYCVLLQIQSSIIIITVIIIFIIHTALDSNKLNVGICFLIQYYFRTLIRYTPSPFR